MEGKLAGRDVHGLALDSNPVSKYANRGQAVMFSAWDSSGGQAHETMMNKETS